MHNFFMNLENKALGKLKNAIGKSKERVREKKSQQQQ